MVGSISTIGVGSGLDLQGIIDQLREVDEKALIQPKETRVADYAAQLEEFTVVKNKLFTMKSAALNLSLSSTFLSRSVTSSDEDVLTATVSDGTAAQSASMVVTAIASKSSWMSSAGASATDVSVASADDTFEYTFDGDTISVSVSAGTTLSELVDLVNDDADNPGVTASIVNDGQSSPYRFVLKADATGEDNRIAIATQLADLALAEQNGAGGSSLNAQFAIDGINYQRQTNSFSDVMSGVTLTLKSAGSASVTVAANTDTLKTLVTDLVTAYNDLVQEIKTNVAYSEDTGEFGVLAGTTIRDLPLSLQSLMTRKVEADTDGNVTTMFDLGMSFARDGTISIDTAVLDSKLASNASDVQEFFLGNDDEGIVGFADLVNEQLRTLTSSTGQVEAEKNGAQSRMDSLELLITSETDRLNKKYELLSKQFVQLDRYMNQMTSISNYLNSQFNALSSTSQSGSK